MWNRACVTAASGAPSARSIYRVRRAYFVRALGRVAVAAAVLLLATTLSLTLPAPGILTTVLVVLTTVALVALAIIAVSVVMPPTLLQLDLNGFRASKRHSSGPRQGNWGDVQSVASQEGPNGWVLLIQHRNGAHTAVPLSVVDASPVAVEEDVRARLNEAHGYRPLP